MRLREVDLPEELITAQNEGDLVLFAGAGVSLDPPSNLPDFETLAREVAGPTDITLRKGESPDRFLGRLADQGADVEARVRGIIDDPDSRPNPLHRLLLRLFPSAEDVRLVTTNFDPHFTSTVHNRFDEAVDIYHAPALPLGRNFQGLVYLHGAVENPRSKLVLTDQDFGLAYLIDGWATDFLREMFAEFTVLFVGYSHEDMVIKYLARGLVADAEYRFALTHPGRDGFWERMGINPVHYPKTPEPDAHEALPEAVSAWVEHVELGAHEHEARIQKIVEGRPPQEPEPADYIATVLDHPTRLRFFVEHAESPEWLEWADEKGALDPLFGSSGTVDKTAEILAHWFAHQYAVDHPAASMGVIHEHGLSLHPTLWRSLAGRLTDEPPPSAKIFSQWIAILLQSVPAGQAGFKLSSLLEACSFPEDRGPALLIFRRLVRPTLTFDRLLGTGVPEVDGRVRLGAEIQIEAEYRQLHQAWEEQFVPHLDELHRDLIKITGSQLAEAHQLLRTVEAGDSDWDSMSYGRSAIEPHEQDRHPDDQDIVIDAARDTLEWMLEYRRDAGTAVISQWSEADAPLLRRLAIHGLARDPELTPDDALRIIMQEAWLYRTPLKHEVFQLIARAYPDAEKETRREFIDYSLEANVLPWDPEGPEDRQTIDYERYNVAVWLQQHAPECDLAQKHLRRMQEKHEDFGPRDHPDLNSYISGVHEVAPQSPEPVEELLQRPGGECLGRILSYREEEREKEEPKVLGADSYEGILEAVTSATDQQPRWGVDLAAEAVREKEWDERLWNALLRGLEAADVGRNLWPEILDLFEGFPNLLIVASPLSRLLRDSLEDQTLPETFLESVERLSDRLFEAAVENEEDTGRLVGEDWVTTAINHPGGYVAQLWLQSLSRQQEDREDEMESLPDAYRERFDDALRSDAKAGNFASVILASQLPFLHYLDPDWTEAHLIPRFDWERDRDDAERAWHGFLVWGRFTEPLLEHLLPYLIQSFGRLDDELQSHRRAFCQRLAAVALHSEIHPLEDQWLPRFIETADEESRELWAAAIGRRLDSMKAEARETVWHRWIQSYWSDRTEGVPRPLTEGEASRMVEWVLALEPVIEEALELVRQVPTPFTLDRGLLFRIRESDLLATEPALSAQLVLHLLESTDELTHECSHALEITEELVERGLEITVARTICERLVSLGCVEATELQRRLGNGE